ncbi:MAG: response regulator [Ignavibacteria bacterium]|nr:response regulator [Ignavibacteria bacterium]MBT8381018.1 response regulator [Ignavibacteria bacterium]MBT8390526.1 response regulator [Ignavibacteria bacterium]NNJ51779.1 response regulator [Ignavibacteriaceae bacterium]NNL22787.1 response regulator [Ignavibacteriaceae bacterium]
MKEQASTYFNLYYDFLPFPVQVIDEKGFVEYINKEFSTLWGYSLAELREYSCFDDNELIRRGVAEKVKNIFQTKKALSLKNYIDTLLFNGERSIPFLKSTLFPLTVDDKNFVVLFHEDQTEVILSEEESKKARDANKEAERLKSTFLNVLSHELRTPLNIILGYSTIIKENLKDKIGNEDKIYLDNLHSGSERLFKSITQMLEFAQIEAGNYHLNLETFELVSIFHNCLTQHKKRAEEKNLNFTTNFTEEKIFVEIDLQCAENIINNLIDNSVKFTPKGYIEVELGILKERDLAICKLKDTGVGISTQYLDHLYQPFSQEDLEIGRTFEGNGLGLAISKRYIEKMGGSLIVDSIKGVGSTFTFTLPLAKGAKAEKLQAITQKSNGTPKILMLDDAGESYDLVKAFLKDDFEISLINYIDFNPGVFEKEKFIAVIFDVTKNYWDKGIELCKDLKENIETEVPIIILSSEFLSEKISQFYEAGAKEFLVKPFAKNDLIDMITRITTPTENPS